MTEPAARLTALLDEAERQAHSINLDNGWYSPDDLTRSHHDGGAGLAEFDADHIATWSPARVLDLIDRDRAALRAQASAGAMVADHVAACGPDLCGHRDYLAATAALSWMNAAVDAALRFWEAGPTCARRAQPCGWPAEPDWWATEPHRTRETWPVCSGAHDENGRHIERRDGLIGRYGNHQWITRAYPYRCVCGGHADDAQHPIDKLIKAVHA